MTGPRIYIGKTSFEHPVTGADVAVEVTFRAAPPEPEIGVLGNTYEVVNVTHNVPFGFSESGVDDHVDGLTPEWFAGVIRDYEDERGDWEYHSTDWEYHRSIDA